MMHAASSRARTLAPVTSNSSSTLSCSWCGASRSSSGCSLQGSGREQTRRRLLAQQRSNGNNEQVLHILEQQLQPAAAPPRLKPARSV